MKCLYFADHKAWNNGALINVVRLIIILTWRVSFTVFLV